MRARKIIVALVALFISQVALAQNYILNGGFESPSIIQNSLSPVAPDDWVYARYGWVMNGNVGDPGTWPGPHSGQQYADAGNGAGGFGLSQAVVLPSAGTYSLSWFENAGIRYTRTPYEVEILDSGQNLVASWNFSTALLGGVWVPQGANFSIAAGGPCTVGFFPNGNGNNADVLLDDVALTAISVPATPHPGDANDDGAVDVVDLGILAQNYDTATGATWAMGDFNRDGAVDVVDLGILAQNYDWTGTPAGAVPEPMTLSLLVLGGLVMLRRRVLPKS